MSTNNKLVLYQNNLKAFTALFYKKLRTIQMITVILITSFLLAIGFAGFAITILVKKNGKFPELHIGNNKDLKKRGIGCATSQDKMEQAKAKKSLQFKQLTLLEKELKSL
ncbi:hypothetical protein GNY23_00100 [Labilibaculum sp. 44]|uniref:Uncharacterized protein n=1 Tax=Labilibaculum euxinus TaxID=2686357 RepID=A0A7M4D0P6_9BACT|nr:hypothetical protein [Labilibaculum euxinus]MVB05430.1 hypothetical protein [Labilibaculum euxinus]